MDLALASDFKLPNTALESPTFEQISQFPNMKTETFVVPEKVTSMVVFF